MNARVICDGCGTDGTDGGAPAGGTCPYCGGTFVALEPAGDGPPRVAVATLETYVREVAADGVTMPDDVSEAADAVAEWLEVSG